mgnify:CR=1 FL=1
MLYVHKDRQGQGAAGRILFELEIAAAALGKAVVCADVSLTARPFFEHMGYETVCSKAVMRRGVELANFRMVKRIF